MGGATRLEAISKLGIGCWQFGDIGSEIVPESVSLGVINAALAAGVNHFDTAQDYGAGRSESVVGRALAGRPEVFVASKMNLCGAQETRKGVQASLGRLRRDCIDLFYIHWPQTGKDAGPMMEALEEARAHGRIRSHRREQFLRGADAGCVPGRPYRRAPALLQPPVEVPGGGADPVLPGERDRPCDLQLPGPGPAFRLGAAGASFCTRGSPSGTVFYQPDVWPHVRDGVQELEKIAAEANRPLAHLALRWLLDSGWISSVLVGSRSRAHLASNLAAFEGSVAPEVMRKLEEASARIHRHIPRVGNIFKFYP